MKMKTWSGVGFTHAEMETAQYSTVKAHLNTAGTSFVISDDQGEIWGLNETSCRDFASFFLTLADELKRRKLNDVPF